MYLWWLWKSRLFVLRWRRGLFGGLSSFLAGAFLVTFFAGFLAAVFLESSWGCLLGCRFLLGCLLLLFLLRSFLGWLLLLGRILDFFSAAVFFFFSFSALALAAVFSFSAARLIFSFSFFAFCAASSLAAFAFQLERARCPFALGLYQFALSNSVLQRPLDERQLTIHVYLVVGCDVFLDGLQRWPIALLQTLDALATITAAGGWAGGALFLGAFSSAIVQWVEWYACARTDSDKYNDTKGKADLVSIAVMRTWRETSHFI